jgi:hypothetical protein
VFVTSYKGGSITRVAKDGSGSTVVVNGHYETRGVAIDGNSLYWTNGSFAFDDSGSYWGGVWKCTLPNCTDHTVVYADDFVTHPDVRNGFVFYGSTQSDEVYRVPSAGGTRETLGSGGNFPFDTAADDAHVYYTSQQTTFYRAPFDGGPSEVVGTQGGNALGFVAVDAERVYWVSVDGAGKGVVQSADKAQPAGAKITYSGADDESSVGVAIDTTHVYWSNDGTLDGGTPVGNGRVRACPKSGCTGAPIEIASGLRFAGPIALDANAIYFVESGAFTQGAVGKVWKVAKP